MPKPQVLILTEAGKKFGFGHITRCLALRAALISQGGEVTLIANGDSLAQRFFFGQKVVWVCNWHKNFSSVVSQIQKASAVIIDSYYAPLSFYKRVEALTPVPVYIDDYVRLSYPRGIIVSGAIGSEKFKYKRRADQKYLLGTRHILLRPEFWDIPQKKIRKKIGDILISVGGVDRPALIQQIVREILNRFPKARFHIIASRPPKNPRRFKAQVRYRFKLTAAQVKALMLRCDISISGGGQTTNELAACGLPTIGICLAQNQKRNLQGWERVGILRSAGTYQNPNLAHQISKIAVTLQDVCMRHKMSRQGHVLVDGQGALRVANCVLKSIERL